MLQQAYKNTLNVVESSLEKLFSSLLFVIVTETQNAQYLFRGQIKI